MLKLCNNHRGAWTSRGHINSPFFRPQSSIEIHPYNRIGSNSKSSGFSESILKIDSERKNLHQQFRHPRIQSQQGSVIINTSEDRIFQDTFVSKFASVTWVAPCRHEEILGVNSLHSSKRGTSRLQFTSWWFQPI